jgi:hypothetical protein
MQKWKPTLPVLANFLALLCVFLAKPGLGINGNPALGRTFFVDALHGNDANDGLSPRSAWRSLDKVNEVQLQPAEKVLFKRGEAWRGQLIPHSGREGAPITYGAYGRGARPQLIGSVNYSQPADWRTGPSNTWVAGAEFVELGTAPGFTTDSWRTHSEASANVRVTKPSIETNAEPPIIQVACSSQGLAENHIQLYTAGLGIEQGYYYTFTFRAESTVPFTIPLVKLMKSSPPWTSYGIATTPPLHVGRAPEELRVRFKALTTAVDARLTVYLGRAMPPGATFSFRPVALKRARCANSNSLIVDVGNIVFDEGKSTGVKKWSREDLKRPGDFWYDEADWQVYLCADRNPAEANKSIELALMRALVQETGRSYVNYESLALLYGAAHGFGGGSTHHILIRDCDISWMGGGLQFRRPDGSPVRYGNGIEFWGDAHDNMVENCRLWEIYDAALTNQGNESNKQYNITYRNNVIWNCEYSFEYWNREGSKTHDIHFENNTCLDAGFSWGHAQRPHPNGRHLMFGYNPAETRDFYVRRNIFRNATESIMRMENDWTSGLLMDSNCLYQASGLLVEFLENSWATGQFADYNERTGLDLHSVLTDPKLVNSSRRDFRPSPKKFVRKFSRDVGPLGAQERLKE